MESTKVGTIEYGAFQAVKNCLRVSPGEKVVIITDVARKHIGYEIAKQAEKITQGNVKVFIMEDFGERPEDGSFPLPFPEEIGEALKSANVSFYAAKGKKGELKSFRIPMLKIVEENKLRHGHMPNIDDILMTTGMAVDYSEVQKISQKVYNVVSKARFIKVTTPLGTDFTAEFNPNWRWKISSGYITSLDWSNLPDGEVYTCIYKMPYGKLVVDGVLGDYFCERYGVLEKTPVTIIVEDGRANQIYCVNQKLVEELKEYMKQDENANRIAEFAIGTNIGLKELVGNLLQDEKFPGVHVAFGHGYPEKTGSDWKSDAHVDVIMKNATVVVDDKTEIMRDGKFTI